MTEPKKQQTIANVTPDVSDYVPLINKATSSSDRTVIVSAIALCVFGENVFLAAL